MISKQNIFRLTLYTFLVLCSFSLVANAQRSRTSSRCAPGSWVEGVAKLGQPASTVYFLSGLITVEVTNGDGNLEPVGGYFKVTNDTSDTIEFQPDNTTSIWYPLESGRQSSPTGIPQYRSKNDRSPTNYSVRIRYKCGAAASGAQRQNTNTNSKQSTSAVSQKFPYGCWVIPAFTYSDPGYTVPTNVPTQYFLFEDNNEVYWNSGGGSSTRFKFQIGNGEIKTTEEFVEYKNQFVPIGGTNVGSFGDYYIFKAVDGGKLQKLRYYYQVVSENTAKYDLDDREASYFAERSDKCSQFIKK